MNIGYRQVRDTSDLSLKILNEQLEAIWQLLLRLQKESGGGADGK